MSSNRNYTTVARSDEELSLFRREKWKLYIPPQPLSMNILGREVNIRPGLTFTPFANPIYCNAHCQFCSEELIRVGYETPASRNLIKDYDWYFSALEEVLLNLANLRMGLSLSGLEVSAEPDWFMRLINLLIDLSPLDNFDEKVIYSNGSGFCRYPYLIEPLKGGGFDRMELSRCHYDETINQKIMRFNRDEPVRLNRYYEETVKELHSSVTIKGSCIVNRLGINSIDLVESYIDWASSLGIRTVVFREMSRLSPLYKENRVSRWIEENRIPIDNLYMKVASNLSDIRDGWNYLYSTFGYYYYNEHYLWRDSIEVIFETSSYEALAEINSTNIIQKLIFHSNGNLTTDWHPDSHVIATLKRVSIDRSTYR
jgi:hypothetical protein